MLLYLAGGLHRVVTAWIFRGLAYMGAAWANVIPKVLARGTQNSQNQTAMTTLWCWLQGGGRPQSPGVRKPLEAGEAGKQLLPEPLEDRACKPHSRPARLLRLLISGAGA